MAFLEGLELMIAKPLLALLGKIGISGKFAYALSAGVAVGISAVAIRAGIQWANKAYGVDLKEQWIIIGKKAVEIALSSPSCIEALDRLNEEVSIQLASSILAKYGSEAFGTELDLWTGEASIAAFIHAIGDQTKLGLTS